MEDGGMEDGGKEERKQRRREAEENVRRPQNFPTDLKQAVYQEYNCD